MTEVKLNIIRNWPEGFDARLQHVWLDVVSMIPNVKLYDLQRVLAEFGFTMKVYEDAAPQAAAEPVGYCHEDGDRFMPLEVFKAWRNLAATPDKAAEWRPVVWARSAPR